MGRKEENFDDLSLAEPAEGLFDRIILAIRRRRN